MAVQDERTTVEVCCRWESVVTLDVTEGERAQLISDEGSSESRSLVYGAMDQMDRSDASLVDFYVVVR